MATVWKAFVSPLDGQVTAELEMSKFSFREVLSNIGGWQATVRTRHWASTTEYIKPRQTIVWFVADDGRILPGLLWSIKPPASSDENDITLIGTGLWGISEKLNNTIARVFTQRSVAQMLNTIIPALWIDKMTNLPGLQYSVHAHNASDNLYDLEIKSNSRRAFKDIIDTVVRLDDAVDFIVEAEMTTTQVFRATFKIFKAEYDLNNNVLDTAVNARITNWVIDASQQYNSITMMGQLEEDDDEGNAQTYTILEIAEDIAIGDLPLEKIVADNTSNSSDRKYLQSKAKYYLDLWNDEITEFDVEILDPNLINRHRVGQIVRVNSDNLFDPFSRLFRIQAIKTQLQEDGRTAQFIEVYQRMDITVSTTKIPKTANIPNGRNFDGFIEELGKNMKLNAIELSPFTGHGAKFVATPTPPTPPTSLMAVEGSDELALSWTASTELPLATGYDIEWGTGGSYTLGSASVTTTNYTITSLMDGTAYNVRVRATTDDAESGWVSGTFTTTTILTAPSFTDDTGDAQTWTQNNAITNITVPAATGSPTPSYAAVGTLPAGITFTPSTRRLSGTPTAIGSGTIRIRATNSQGSDDWTVTYTTTVELTAPSFTDDTGDAQTWTQNNAITNITVPAATGSPTPSYAAVGTLPAGITFTPSTRRLSGTPTAIGSGTIRIRATNSQGSDDWTVTYTTTVELTAPSFTDDTGDAQTWTQNNAITNITVPAATGSPTPSYAAVGTLPAGITFTPSTRRLSGTPTAIGSGTIRIRATNSQGSDDWTVTYTTTVELTAPSFTDDTGDAQTWTQNNAITNITVPAATGSPTPSYAAVGTLPAGITFTPSTRRLSGTPTAIGSGTIRIRATNSQGSDDWTVTYTTTVELTAPSFTDDTGDAQTWTQNNAITNITVPAATGSPTPSYAAVGTLPAGITFTPSTRRLSGTPTAIGSGTIRIRATNSQGSDDWTVTYTTTVELTAPSFTDDTGDAQTWTQNNAITNITVPAATGSPTPSYAAVGTLPAGITFTPSTRRLSGTPTAIGSGTIRIRATNSQGSDDWTVTYTTDSSSLGRLLVVDGTDDDLWELDPDGSNSEGTLLRDVPSGLTVPAGMTSHNGRLFVVNSGGDDLWELNPDGSNSEGTLLRDVPSGLTIPAGMTSHNGRLLVVDRGGDDLWELNPDGSNSEGTTLRNLPSGLTFPSGMTSHNGRLFVVDNGVDVLWELNPDGSNSEGTSRTLPSGLTSPQGMTSYNGRLLIVDSGGDDLWELDPDGANGQGTLLRDLPSGLTAPVGMASY